MNDHAMHDDQLFIDTKVAERLVATQFPQWARLDVTPICSHGTSNALFRLGDRMALRLPLQPRTSEQIEKEHKWLPAFASHLSLAIPVPLAVGTPDESYPCAWTVCEWIDGENATLDRLHDPVEAAQHLAQFILELQAIDATLGPAPGAHNFQRGIPLAERDQMTRKAISRCEGLIDIEFVRSAWRADLSAETWTEPSLWIHGDLTPGNLVARDGQLVGVIDWGGLGVGDPATDLLPAWNLFHGSSRDAFRNALSTSDATWARGRGVALSVALVALPYYLNTNPEMVRSARHVIEAVRNDVEGL